MAKANPFRFSTKYQDDETDLLYYGHRHLNASAGRWLNRDLVGILGGPNLYGFVRNAPVLSVDKLGALPTGYFVEDGIGYRKGASFLQLHYPSNGPKCACRGKRLGMLVLDIWLDADRASSIQEGFPAEYEYIAGWPYWNQRSLRTFQNPGYVGAGISVMFVPSGYADVCCKKRHWWQTRKSLGGLDYKYDGDFLGDWYLDSPGGLVTRHFATSEEFHLSLWCDDWGPFGDEVASWNWSYSVTVGPPLRVELITPF